jgi:RimJ/RimL family protein N-acetyltransferase
MKARLKHAIGYTETMVLQDFSTHDFELVERILSDPRIMDDFGGIFAKEKIEKAQRHYLASAESEEGWVFAIRADEGSAAAGLAFLWDRPWRDDVITELVVQILPEFQRRGLAAAAAGAVIARARAERRCKSVHAFPPEASSAAAALCAGLGFAKLDKCDVDFAGARLRARHWRLDL